LDLFDRRTIFEFALLWYCIATLIMACQSTPVWLHFGRLLAGLGIGVEFVTIDTLLSELVPKERRGRTIFVGFMIAFCLRNYATTGVFLFIAGAMVIVASMVAVMGPRTARLRLEAISR
jgi:putative MFS transporter